MVEASLAKGSSDLRFLLTHHKVTADEQAKLYDNSIDTVAKFAAFVSDATDLREVLKTDLGIDPASSLSLRAQAASLMVAWETAKARVKTQAEAEATNEVREWAKPIPQTDYIAMRQAFATQFGDLEDKHIPAKEYIEKKLHELETGEFRAEPLTEVISRDEVDPDVLLPRWNAMLQNALIMIKLKHPGRAELADVTFAESGSLIPPWPLILSYEHAIRKHAYKLMATDGRSFGDALSKAYKDATVKERHFTTPLALHAKRPSPTVPPPPLNPYQRDPKKGKGKQGKGKDKQPTKFGTLAGTSNRTPDGKPICYRFNAKGGCKKGAKCHFAHVCLHCFAKHPATECPSLKNKKDDKQQETASAWGSNATIECVDICRSAKMDLTKSALRQSYLDQIQAKKFDAILLSPACSSFSRAPFANHRGPRPVRCYQHPRGKDTLTARERDRAILGNVFADFAWEVATLVAQGAANFLAFEQPEDLGAIHKGPFAGQRPASMWQWGRPSSPLPSGNQYGGLFQHRAKELFATSGSERWSSNDKNLGYVVNEPEGRKDYRDGGGPSWDWLREKTLDLVLKELGATDVRELEREAFRMAAGGEHGCSLAKNEKLQSQLRLLRGLLEAAGDPDREFLRRAEEGLPLGILEQLPRTPHVFEEQLKWPLENEKFDEDVEEGLMARMTLREFKERYGENPAIASLAIIVEDELKDKKRIIHDATHGVRVNHRIKCRDKIRAPGAREKKQLLREMIDENRVAFSVVGDISKAHRRYKHQPSEHGFMGCQLSTEETISGDPDSQLVYVNLVGTFGLSCASYWWTRIAACGVRFPLDLLLYADDLESLGMETDYPGHQLGLSKKRADWLVEWLRDKATRGRVSAKEFSQGLGRLGFAAMALDWERPFLGPLHAWSSAVQTKVGTLTVPTMLRVLCLWLAERLEAGGRLQRPAPLVEEGTPLSFFTDAKAEAGKAWIGGFLELVPGCQGRPEQGDCCPWVPEGPAKKTTRVAIRGYTDNKSNEALLKKAMTTKFPSTLVLMETAEELSAKNCELQLQWIRRDLNQLADDLTNENFASFDPEFRVKLEGSSLEWRILDRLLEHSSS
ncbi:DSK1 [Symbiodinium sp. KB8]|nr:DSK1 [Symbiodinium sp. KB8]